MTLQLYILRELLVGFCFTVGGMLVLTLPAVAVSVVNKLSGVDMRSVLMYLPLVLAGLVPYVLPLGFLLTVVATYGRLAADNEWTAIRMSGTQPLKMYAPGFALGLVLAAVTAWMVGDVLPQIRHQQARFVYAAASDMIRHLNPGRTELAVGDYFLNARSREGQDFVDCFIYIPPHDDKPSQTMVADRVQFTFDDRSMFMTLRNARIVLGDQDVRIENPRIRIDLDSVTDVEESSYNSVRYRSSADMIQKLKTAELTPSQSANFRYEVQYRRALSSTYFMFLLLGASTGILLRRGTQLGALSVSVGYALIYYLLSMRLGKQLAASHVLPPEASAWFVVALGLVAGIVLTRKAMRQ